MQKTIYFHYFIFFLDRAQHEEATQKVSYFYHAPVISYEFCKKLHMLIFSEKDKPIEILLLLNLLPPSVTDKRPLGRAYADRGADDVDRRVLPGSDNSDGLGSLARTRWW
jgi:hypothetical protein